jgi:catechol 2,3-dioxygenase-like lactoylglutathione lyase family enzyme
LELNQIPRLCGRLNIIGHDNERRRPAIGCMPQDPLQAARHWITFSSWEFIIKGPPILIEAIDHVNIVVRDILEMTAFYRDVLEMKVTKTAAIKGDWVDTVVGLDGVVADVVYLEVPGSTRLELIEYHAPKIVDSSNHDQPHAAGIRHFAFRVSDIDALKKGLDENGVKTFSEVVSVPEDQVKYKGGACKRLLYFQDPEANLLEFCEYK